MSEGRTLELSHRAVYSLIDALGAHKESCASCQSELDTLLTFLSMGDWTEDEVVISIRQAV